MSSFLVRRRDKRRSHKTKEVRSLDSNKKAIAVQYWIAFPLRKIVS
ncbi:MAG: hypothetical protein RMY64_25655 [Nostoc sp. DedQUE08]|nr:hypothetical protein [Nostoc sp. DedQUE08]